MSDAPDIDKALDELERMAANKAAGKVRTPEQREKMSLAQRVRWAEYWRKKREEETNGGNEAEEG